MKKYMICMMAIPLLALAFEVDKSATTQSKACGYAPLADPRGVMINEGFEGVFPPVGWDTVSVPGGTQGGAALIPWNQDNNYFYSGSYGAAYGWGYNLDGWLRILSLDFSQVSNITLSFWWESSYYWHVSPYDNGDLFVKVSTDGGTNWDQLWTFGDSADVVNSGGVWPWDNWIYYYATLNLDTYAGLPDVYIGFHVVANDNADMAIDDVVIDTTATGIVEEKSNTNPNNINLFNAQPNPTRNNAMVSFNLLNATDAKLNIYDKNGCLIKTLLDGSVSSGYHSVNWDGCDKYGVKVPSGIYFYTLTANTFATTKNIIVLR